MKEKITTIIAIILSYILIMFILSTILTLTWNYVMPYLFGLAKLDFWRSFCLLVTIDCLVAPVTTSIQSKKDI